MKVSMTPINVRKQMKWGLAVFGVGLILLFLPFGDIYFGDAHLGPLLLIFGGSYVAGVGLALYARSIGASVVWCVGASFPFVGPFVGLIGILLQYSFRKWVRKKTETPLLPRRTFIRAVVVFTIIWGSLMAVTIPNSMTYGAKARQSEAKVGLGSIYVSATAFHEKYDADHKTYEVSDIKQLSYSPSGTPRYRFWYAVNGVPTLIPGNYQSNSCDGPPTTIRVAASATGFTAAARGNIDSDVGCDEWSINDARVLTNTLNDITH
jgi:hypothetical protein